MPKEERVAVEKACNKRLPTKLRATVKHSKAFENRCPIDLAEKRAKRAKYLPVGPAKGATASPEAAIDVLPRTKVHPAGAATLTTDAAPLASGSARSASEVASAAIPPPEARVPQHKGGSPRLPPIDHDGAPPC